MAHGRSHSRARAPCPRRQINKLICPRYPQDARCQLRRIDEIVFFLIGTRVGPRFEEVVVNAVDVKERDEGPGIEDCALDVGTANARTSTGGPGGGAHPLAQRVHEGTDRLKRRLVDPRRELFAQVLAQLFLIERHLLQRPAQMAWEDGETDGFVYLSARLDGRPDPEQREGLGPVVRALEMRGGAPESSFQMVGDESLAHALRIRPGVEAPGIHTIVVKAPPRLAILLYLSELFRLRGLLVECHGQPREPVLPDLLVEDMRQQERQGRFLFRGQDNRPAWEHLLQKREMGAFGVDILGRDALERATLLGFVDGKTEPPFRDHSDVGNHAVRARDHLVPLGPLGLALLRHSAFRPALECLDLVDAGGEKLRFMIPSRRPLPGELRGHSHFAVGILLFEVLRHTNLVEVVGVEHVQRRGTRIEIDIEPVDKATSGVSCQSALNTDPISASNIDPLVVC